MKILQLANTFSRTGGVGVYCLRLAKALRQSGHEVSVIHGDVKAERIEGVKTIYAGEFHRFSHPDNGKMTTTVMEMIRAENPDIIHVQNNQNMLLEYEIRDHYPAVKSIHVHDFCPTGNKFHHAGRRVCEHRTGPMCIPRMVYKRCTRSKNPGTIHRFYRYAVSVNRNNRHYLRFIAASEYVKNQLVENDYEASRVSVLPYFVPEPADSTPSYSGTPIIMYSGRAYREKGMRELIEAVSLLPKELAWELVIDAEGPEIHVLRKLASKLKVDEKIRFPGWLDTEKHEQLYRKSAFVVFPSVWPEPFGLVGPEAMSYGKPVVAFDVGGVKDWLKDGETGFLIKPYDIGHMAEKIRFLIENPEETRAMGEQGMIEARKEFSEIMHVQGLEKIYRDVMDEFRRQG